MKGIFGIVKMRIFCVGNIVQNFDPCKYQIDLRYRGNAITILINLKNFKIVYVMYVYFLLRYGTAFIVAFSDAAVRL